MTNHKGLQLLDPATVRSRRMRLGYTESRLAGLCGVSSTVIRGIERGGPQDDLSLRFVAVLADKLKAPVHELLTDQHRPTVPTPARNDDGRTLGALLLAVGERVPAEAICEVLDWDFARLDDATIALAQLLEAAGGIIVEADGTLAIADDVCPIHPDDIQAAARAAFARRNPRIDELRTVLRTVRGAGRRLEDVDTPHGRLVSRLRTVGLLVSSETSDRSCSDVPLLSQAVRYSLLLDDDPAEAEPDETPDA